MAWSLEDIARALGPRPHAYRGGSVIWTNCPCHPDRSPSLSLSIGEEGRLLVYCKALCPREEILRAIRTITGGGTYEAPEVDHAKIEAEKAMMKAWAQRLWSEAAEIRQGDLADRYLTGRLRQRLPGGWPASFRYHPDVYRKNPTLYRGPAVVSAVTRWPDDEVRAVQCIALAKPGQPHDGKGRPADLEKPKWTPAFGQDGGAAVRLTPWAEGQRVVITEGVESGLAVVAAGQDVAVWACLSAGNAAHVRLPPHAPLSLFLDGDKAGRIATRQAKADQELRGHEVLCADVPDGMDPLDLWLGPAG